MFPLDVENRLAFEKVLGEYNQRFFQNVQNFFRTKWKRKFHLNTSTIFKCHFSPCNSTKRIYEQIPRTGELIKIDKIIFVKNITMKAHRKKIEIKNLGYSEYFFNKVLELTHTEIMQLVELKLI